MSRTLARLSWLVCLLMLPLWIGSGRSTGEHIGVSAAGVTTPEPLVLHADDAGLTLEWIAPTWHLYPVEGKDGLPYTAVEAEGWDFSDQAGQPQLPQATALIAAPPEGAVEMRIETWEVRYDALPHPLLPAPCLTPMGNPAYALVPTWTPPEPPMSTDWVALEEAGRLRGRRLLRLTFRPLRADSRGLTLESVAGVRVELRFNDRPQPAVAAQDDSPLLSALQETVLNPAQLAAFGHPTEAQLSLQEQFVAPPDTEYLIIAPTVLITTVAPLAAHRATVDGLRVFSVTAEAIYHAYSNDVITATAIRDYISATYHSASPPVLDYVLLVGDGNEHPQAEQRIPPYLLTDPWNTIGEGIAADNRFVTVDGDDILPDLAIGRLPVNTVAEAETVIGKILAYEQSPPQWPWNARALFFAGNALSPDPTRPDPVQEARFRFNADSLYLSLPVTITGQRTYFCTVDCTEPYHYTDINLAAALTRGQLNGGGLLAVYSGHSSWHQWTVVLPGGETMFHVSDISGLRNGGALPLVIEMTCLTGRFAYWESATLDESLVRHPKGGAIATWGPAGLGNSDGHAVLGGRFFDYLFKKGMTRLGDLTTAAKLDLFKSGRNLDLLDSFVLLGDPAMRLNLTIVPWADHVFLPLVNSGY